MKHFIKYLPAYGWALGILYLCTVNPSDLPKVAFQFIWGTDKLVHFIMFGTQALLIILSSAKTFKNYLQAFFLSAGYGVTIEIVQGLFFANRSFDYADMLANALGAFTVLFTVAIVKMAIKQKVTVA